MVVGDLHYGGHVGCEAVEVDGQDCSCAWCDEMGDELWVEQIAVGGCIAGDRDESGAEYGKVGSVEGMCADDYLVAVIPVVDGFPCEENEGECVESVGYSDAVLLGGEGGPFLLEAFGFIAAEVDAALDYSLGCECEAVCLRLGVLQGDEGYCGLPVGGCGVVEQGFHRLSW